jgi:hypothetical protein
MVMAVRVPMQRRHDFRNIVRRFDLLVQLG